MAKFADHMDKVAEGVTEGYRKIEEGVVGGYKKIENGVVNGFNKVSDAFVNTFIAREGESVADAKARLTARQQAGKDTGAEASGNADKNESSDQT